ncbi:MAG: calcineurin-like phosphoesterase C-terminal domain-containing protein [Planctomycetota bacterium]
MKLSSCFAALSACFVLSVTSAQAQTVRGTVFDDRNANGTFDQGEPVIPGVRVSNGSDVAITDAQGGYELSIDDDEIVFVIKPEGYQVRIDAQNLPRFYYIHKPAGSPDEDFLFKGVEPTGGLPESVDFPLTRFETPAAFEVLLFGDPQPYTAEEMRFYANEIIERVRDNRATFAVALGDLVGDDLSLFEPLNEVQAGLGIPIYNVYGNHDMNFRSAQGATSDEYADETFERVYGPATYAVQYGDTHFIFVDNVYYRGYKGDRPPRGEAWDGNRWLTFDGQREAWPITNNYEGRLTPKQMAFIKNYLATLGEDQQIMICTHIPLLADQANSVHQVRGQIGELMKLLSRFKSSASFSGHTHLNRHWYIGSEWGFNHASGKPHHHFNAGTASGSWWRGQRDPDGVPHALMADGTPPGWVAATFEGSGYQARFVSNRPGDARDMRIIAPLEIKGVENTTGTIVRANIWAGTGETSKTRMRIMTGGKASAWSTMQHKPQADPVYAQQAAAEQQDAKGYRPVGRGPIASHNMFEGRLPAELPKGTHVLEIESTDLFGQTVRGSQSFMVR